MRTRTLLVAVVLVAAALSGCGGDDDTAGSLGSDVPSSFPPPPTSPAPSTVLTTGKSLVPLAAGSSYQSPDGFAPMVTVAITGDGWVSTHRSTDAFDVSQPRTDADAALVVLAFMVPSETTNA